MHPMHQTNRLLWFFVQTAYKARTVVSNRVKVNYISICLYLYMGIIFYSFHLWIPHWLIVSKCQQRHTWIQMYAEFSQAVTASHRCDKKFCKLTFFTDLHKLLHPSYSVLKFVYVLRVYRVAVLLDGVNFHIYLVPRNSRFSLFFFFLTLIPLLSIYLGERAARNIFTRIFRFFFYNRGVQKSFRHYFRNVSLLKLKM